MKQNFYDLISIIPYLNYKIYCIQFRNLNQVHGAFNLVYKNTSVSKAFFEVRPSIQNDIYVTVVPGASSVTSALQISSIPTDKYIFYGFGVKMILQFI